MLVDCKLKVSVIINFHNSEKYIYDCLESVVCQSYKNLEIILYDNKSTDNSKKIIDQFKDKRIRYIRSSKFYNLGKARCIALKKATGDWFCFLDSDDYWNKDKIQLQIDIIKKSKDNNLGIVYSQFYIHQDNYIKSIFLYALTKKYKNKLLLKKIQNGNIYKKLLMLNFISLTTVLFNSKFLSKEININPKLNMAEDYDLLIKYSKVSNAQGINMGLAYYRIHNDNISNNNFSKSYEEILFILKNEINQGTAKKYILKFHELYFVLNLINKKNYISFVFNYFFKLYFIYHIRLYLVKKLNIFWLN